jgi:hypothetical protein
VDPGGVRGQRRRRQRRLLGARAALGRSLTRPCDRPRVVRFLPSPVGVICSIALL